MKIYRRREPSNIIDLGALAKGHNYMMNPVGTIEVQSECASCQADLEALGFAVTGSTNAATKGRRFCSIKCMESFIQDVVAV